MAALVFGLEQSFDVGFGERAASCSFAVLPLVHLQESRKVLVSVDVGWPAAQIKQGCVLEEVWVVTGRCLLCVWISLVFLYLLTT